MISSDRPFEWYTLWVELILTLNPQFQTSVFFVFGLCTGFTKVDNDIHFCLTSLENEVNTENACMK